MKKQFLFFVIILLSVAFVACDNAARNNDNGNNSNGNNNNNSSASDEIYVNANSQCTQVGADESVRNWLTLGDSGLIKTSGSLYYSTSPDCSGVGDVYLMVTVTTIKVEPEVTASFDPAKFVIKQTPTKFEAYAVTNAGVAVVPTYGLTKGVWKDVTSSIAFVISPRYGWFKIYNGGSTVSAPSSEGYGAFYDAGNTDLAALIADGEPTADRQRDYVLNALTATQWLPAR